MRREQIEYMREKHPPGSRVELHSMTDPYHPVEPGTMGTVRCIDDMGTIHVNWDDGRQLGIVPGEDQFTLYPPEHELKLYMPLKGHIYYYDEYGDVLEYDDPYNMDGAELLAFEDIIQEQIIANRMPEEELRGVMNWYHEIDSVNKKVRSMLFEVEAREKQLWGVAVCQVTGTLSEIELEILKEYISGQASDGWGEGFEQQEIKVSDGELYVSLWNSSNSWELLTEEERFGQEELQMSEMNM